MTIPAEVVAIRREICARCPTPCAAAAASTFAADPCSACALTPPGWGQYGRCQNFGLGDAVAAVAQPIAGLIDAVAGTNLKGCGGCAQRKEALNRLVPRL